MGDVTNDKIKKALIKRGYIYKDIIGKGGFGEVYLCERVTEKNKSQYAIKLQRNDVKSACIIQQNFITAEMQAIQTIKDNSMKNGQENIVDILEVLKLGEIGQAFVMPYYRQNLRGLFNMVKKQGGLIVLDESSKYRLAEGIIRGVCAAHKMGIAHKDIKPDNILIDDFNVTKLGDFGLAAHKAVCGTRSYMAPELV